MSEGVNDITVLGLGLDSSQVATATPRLNEFAGAAVNAAKGADTLTTATTKLGTEDKNATESGEAFLTQLTNKVLMLGKTRDEALRLEIQLANLSKEERADAEALADTWKKYDAASKASAASTDNVQTALSAVGVSAITATAAIGLLLKVFNDAREAWAVAEASQIRFESMLRATGNAAKTTASHVSEFAGAMQKVTLFDDEAIRDAATSMLKFKEISGQTFDRTLKLSGDLATVMGTDIRHAVELVGRAMENSYGPSMLRRQGLLNDAQVEYIKTLRELGEVEKVHEFLLSSLESTVGGMAEATGGRGLAAANIQLKHALEEVLEKVGESVTAFTKLESTLRGVAEILRLITEFKMPSFALPEIPIPDWMVRMDFIIHWLTSPRFAVSSIISGLGQVQAFEQRGQTAGPPDQRAAEAAAEAAAANKDLLKTINELNEARLKGRSYADQVIDAEERVTEVWNSESPKARELRDQFVSLAAAKKAYVDMKVPVPTGAFDDSAAKAIAGAIAEQKALEGWEKTASHAQDTLAKLSGKLDDEVTPAFTKLRDLQQSAVWAQYPTWLQDAITKLGLAADVTEKEIEFKKELLRQLTEEATRRDAVNSAAVKQAQSAEAAAQKAKDELATFGMSKAALLDLIIARKEEQLVLMERTGTDSPGLIAALRREIEAMKESAAALDGLDLKRANKHQAEETARAWAEMYRDISRAASDFIVDFVEHGSSAFKNLWGNFKAWALRALAEVAAKQVVVSIFGTAAAGAAGAPGAAGTAGNAASMYNAGSSILSGGNAAAGLAATTTNLFGASAFTAAAAGDAFLPAALGAAGMGEVGIGSMIGAMMPAIMAALPWIALAAIAIPMIVKLFDKGDAMRAGTFASGAAAGPGTGNPLFQSSSAFGAFGVINDKWFSDSDMGAQMKAFMESVKGIDNAISAFVGKDRSADIAKALAKVSTDFEAGMEHQGVTFGSIIKERYTVVLNTVEQGLGDMLTAFQGTGDEMATFVLGLIQVHDGLIAANLKGLDLTSLQAFANIGESLPETFNRVVGGYNDFVTAFTTDAERLKTAQDAVTTAFSAMGIALPVSVTAYRELVQGLDLSTEANRALFTSLMTVAPAFLYVSNSASNAAESIATAAQTIADAVAMQRAAYDSLASPARKLADATALVSKTFTDLHLAVPKNTTDMLALIESLDAADPAQRLVIESLNGVVDSFILVSDAADAAATKIAQAADDLMLAAFSLGGFTPGVFPGLGTGSPFGPKAGGFGGLFDGMSPAASAAEKNFVAMFGGGSFAPGMSFFSGAFGSKQPVGALFGGGGTAASPGSPGIADRVDTTAADAIAAQGAQMRITLMELEGKASEALAARRQLELDVMDASLRPLQKQINAQIDLNTENAASAEQTRSQLELWGQIYELNGNKVEAAAVLEKQRAVILAELHAKDPTGDLERLTKKVWDLKDAAKAAADAAAVLDASLRLQAQTAALTADVTDDIEVRTLQRMEELRKLNLQDPSGGLAKATVNLWGLQDAAQAAATALGVLNESLTLQGQIAALTATVIDDAVVQAQVRLFKLDELNKKDPSGGLAKFQQQLWGLEDDATIAAKALAFTNSALDFQRQIYEASGNRLSAYLVVQQQQLIILKNLHEQDPTGALEKWQIALWGLQKAAKDTADLETATSNLRTAYQNQATDLQDVIDKFTDFSATLRKFQESLLTGDLSTLSPEAKMLQTKATFESVATLAGTGDATAMGDLQGASQAYLSAARAYYASSSGYVDAFNAVNSVLDGVIANSDATAGTAAAQLAELTRTVETLIAIKADVKTVAQYMTELVDLRTSIAAENQTTDAFAIDPTAPFVQTGDLSSIDELRMLNGNLTKLIATLEADAKKPPMDPPRVDVTASLTTITNGFAQNIANIVENTGKKIVTQLLE